MQITYLIGAALLVQLCAAARNENFARSHGDFHALIKTSISGLDEGNKATKGKDFSEFLGEEIEHFAIDDNKGQNVDASYAHGNPHENLSPAVDAFDGLAGARNIDLISSTNNPDRKEIAESRGQGMNESSLSQTEHWKDEMLTASYFIRDMDIASDNAALPPSPDPMDDEGSVTKVRIGGNKEEHTWFIVVFFLVLAVASCLLRLKLYMDRYGLQCCRPRRGPDVPENNELARI